MKDQEMEKAQQEKEPEKKNNFKTKIILYVVGIAIIFVIGMVVGIRFSFAVQSSVFYLQRPDPVLYPGSGADALGL